MKPPKELDWEEAKKVAIDFYELNLCDCDDIVALAYQQVLDFIVDDLIDIDQDYITSNYYVYGNYLDSKITFHRQPDDARLWKIFESMNEGQAKNLFEEHIMCS